MRLLPLNQEIAEEGSLTHLNLLHTLGGLVQLVISCIFQDIDVVDGLINVISQFPAQMKTISATETGLRLITNVLKALHNGVHYGDGEG